ncbi:MAG: hypothetical protein AB1938_15060 [Myxococcota bacterium]
MSCGAFEAFLLDETLPKPDGHDAHVAGCASCRALKAAHLSALSVANHVPRRATRVPVKEARRRLSIIAALMLVVGGTSGLVWLRLSPDAAPAEDSRAWAMAPSVEAPSVEVSPVLVAGALEPDDAAAWAGLVDLRDALARDLSSDWRDDEVLSRSFGALPEWVAPTKTYPLRRLGAAASHLIYTSED